MRFLSRRRFLRQTGLASASVWAASSSILSEPTPRRWRAAIIGCTGQGDYGHSLDSAFSGFEHVEVVGLADPDDAGRSRSAQRAKAQRQYSDYRQMLAKERPDLVVVAPRWSERHFE